ncbi:MAG: tetratricopeptide repeat protein, partial [Alphaproteobacteria bacterium]
DYARAYLKQARHYEAAALIEQAIAIREASLGADHPQVAESLTSLAVAHLEAGAPEIAGPMLERALEIFRTAQRPDPADVAEALETYVHVLRKSGNAAQAAKASKEAKDYRQKQAADKDLLRELAPAAP